MKKLALALAVVMAASSPLFAGQATKKQVRSPAAQPQVAKQANKPALDQTRTFSIEPMPGEAAAPAKPRARSGIEVNPWIVPNFM